LEVTEKEALIMVKSAWREYLETIRKRYGKACKKDKKPI
jgi:hypothetical protein